MIILEDYQFLDDGEEAEYTPRVVIRPMGSQSNPKAQDKIAILLNPAAGKGKAGRARVPLEKLLSYLEIPFDLYLSGNEKDLRSLTREMASRYLVLVGAGGDSTFQIMVDELMRMQSRPKFGLIGLGSSNDIAREIGVDSLHKACLALKKGQTRTVDIGCLDGGNGELLYFLGQANIGLGVVVNKDVEGLLRRSPWLGKRQTLAGISAILKAFKQKSVPLPLAVESATGRVAGYFTAVVFSNIRYWATGRLINPGARLDDGNLDACFIGPCSASRLVLLSHLAQRGKHERAREVFFLRAAVFKVRSERPFAVQADGEILGGWSSPSLFTEIQIKAVPHSLALICGNQPC